MQAHVRFPTELEAFNADKLLAHIASHPECTFCQRKFLHADALFEHNRLEHFTCGLCQAQGNYLHFQTQSDMLDHLRQGALHECWMFSPIVFWRVDPGLMRSAARLAHHTIRHATSSPSQWHAMQC